MAPIVRRKGPRAVVLGAGRLGAGDHRTPADAAGPIPTAPPDRAASDFGTDVVFYLAHPEDETLYTIGTILPFIAALVIPRCWA